MLPDEEVVQIEREYKVKRARCAVPGLSQH